MITNTPKMLAAIDKKRDRVFVLAAPNICAVKKDGMWYESSPIPFEEVDKYYEMITDLSVVKKLVAEAKEDLRMI